MRGLVGRRRSRRRAPHLAIVAAVTLVAVLLPAPPASAIVQPSVLTVVGGTGVAGYDTGQGGVATTARFSTPIAVGSADGSIHVADTDNCRIRRIDPVGLVTDVAGTGTCTSSGDGGPATAATLDRPAGIAQGGDGSLVVSDTGACTVRRIAPDGTISRIAGTPGTCGDGGDGGPATTALLHHPTGLAVEADGTVYVADTDNCRIRRIDPDGTIATEAGDGTCGYGGDVAQAHLAQLDHPAGVAVDRRSRVLIADTGNHRVRRVGEKGQIVTIAGTGVAGLGGDGGPAASALLDGPADVTVDAGNRVYVADRGNCRVRAVTGPTITTVVGSTCGAALGALGSVDVTAGGDLVIGDTGDARVLLVDRLGVRDRTVASQYTPLTQAFTALGNANRSPRNWSGGDATYSLRLPDGRVAWLFADSFTGTSVPEDPGWVRPDHSRTAQVLIGNQLVVEDPTTMPPTFTNVWRPGAEGLDTFPAPDAEHRYWPFMPFLKNRTTMVVPLLLVGTTDEVSLAVADVDLPTMTVGTPVPAPGGVIPNANADGDCRALIDHGDTVLVNPDGSGYTYVYGTERCDATGRLYLHLARVPGRVLQSQPWEYFAGTGPGGAPTWSADPLASARLLRTSGAEIDDGGFEYSVTPTTAGYRMIHHLERVGGEIAAAMAPTPWGPFGPSTVVYRPPEHLAPTHANVFATCGLTTYGAKEHPEFGNATELVLSYNVNLAPLAPGGCDGWIGLIELVHNVDNYRPRFVRVPVTDGVALPAA